MILELQHYMEIGDKNKYKKKNLKMTFCIVLDCM